MYTGRKVLFCLISLSYPSPTSSTYSTSPVYTYGTAILVYANAGVLCQVVKNDRNGFSHALPPLRPPHLPRYVPLIVAAPRGSAPSKYSSRMPKTHAAHNTHARATYILVKSILSPWRLSFPSKACCFISLALPHCCLRSMCCNIWNIKFTSISRTIP
ncbi:hypothetical protein F4804DRAFT_242163 [Jackrogersella minutella]|nr:hypothetical protein F4804DRAFT_242163 [Jackrogersella minutella]